MINMDKQEISTNRKMIFIFDERSKYYAWLYPLMKKIKIEKCQTFNFDECSKYFLIDPFLLKEYNLFSQDNESSLDK